LCTVHDYMYYYMYLLHQTSNIHTIVTRHLQFHSMNKQVIITTINSSE